MRKPHSTPPLRGAFNTLAQNGTSYFDKPAIIINGKGSELSNTKAMKGRGKRKLITQTMMLGMIEIAEKRRGSQERIKAYWNTYHCQSKVLTIDGRLHGNYCKNRFCTLCCCIRKAQIINKYLPFISSWEKPYFVTLTIRSRSLRNLNKFMKGMILAFEKIYSNLKKRYQRGNGIRVMGIKSLECNFNPKTKTYNPHFHLIVPDKETADILITEWLKIWTLRNAGLAAQDMRPVQNLESSLVEIVKYGSKIFTEPDLTKKGQGKADPKIYLAALDNIFCAMQGLRIFERFGFNLPKGIEKEPSQTLIAKDYHEWFYDLKYTDWISPESELTLTAYDPEIKLLNLLRNNINSILE